MFGESITLTHCSDESVGTGRMVGQPEGKQGGAGLTEVHPGGRLADREIPFVEANMDP